MPIEITARDRDLVRSRGSDVAELERQLELLHNPPGHTRLLRPCTVGDGIVVLTEEQRAPLIEKFQHRADRFSKLVPASGAATRMFASLRAIVDGDSSAAVVEAGNRLVANVERLPFAAELLSATKGRTDLRSLVAAILGSEGLDLARLPKAMVPFHRYRNESRSASIEHLYEASLHSGGACCSIHFTVSANHRDLLQAHLEAHRERVESATSRQLVFELSTQSAGSDTVALDEHGEILRHENGDIVFRPGGHGALLENLENLTSSGADLVFVKNIDNIMPEHRQTEVAEWKCILGGYLLHVEELLRPFAATHEHELDDEWRRQTVAVLEELGLLSAAARDSSQSHAEFREDLGRPLRVCGVVANHGHTGGGPFWTSNRGHESVQIVETAQIDLLDPGQRGLVESSTHFNPVDLVCSLRDFTGTPHVLSRFVDHRAVFIAAKTYRGRQISALERPGLWNGSMADWNTIFVEVPTSTFAPVKTVFDLLGPDHQPVGT